MGSLLLLLVIFWIPVLFVVVRNVLWDIYTWQVKEYRIDRMITYVLYQEEEKSKSVPIYTIKIISTLGLIGFLIFPSANFLLWFVAVIFGVYVLETMLNIEMLISRRFIRPKISVRNIMLLIGSFIAITLPFIFIASFIISFFDTFGVEELVNINNNIGIGAQSDSLTQLSTKTIEGGIRVIPILTVILFASAIFATILDVTTPLIVGLFVIVTEPFAQIRRMILIRKAQSKVAQIKDLKVIGITGSFGKTTTKEILYQILKKKFKVQKTPKNYNSAVGVAIAINQFLRPDTEIFIAEMGAYTRNEVKKATDVVKPDISIVTGVDNQHLALFGSRENIIKAKFEIIQNAKPDAYAILNGDNEATLRMASMTDKNVILYFTAKDQTKISTSGNIIRKGNSSYPVDSSVIAHSIFKDGERIHCKIMHNGEEHTIKARLNTEHNVSNLLAVIACCLRLQMSMDEIVMIINETNFELPYLNTLNGLNNTTIIDDGYNANSTGFTSALRELKSYKTKSQNAHRIVITKGILELGWEKKTVYAKIAKEIVNSSDILITTDSKLHKAVKQADAQFVSVKITDDFPSFIKAYNALTNEHDVILVEGALNPRVLNEIIDKD